MSDISFNLPNVNFYEAQSTGTIEPITYLRWKTKFHFISQFDYTHAHFQAKTHVPKLITEMPFCTSSNRNIRASSVRKIFVFDHVCLQEGWMECKIGEGFQISRMAVGSCDWQYVFHNSALRIPTEGLQYLIVRRWEDSKGRTKNLPH